MGIEGKIIAITGASRGIGRATAELLAKSGAAVVIGARREEELQRVEDAIVAEGGRATHLVTDVTRREDLQALVACAIDRFGHLDVLINNAGIGPISRFDAMRIDDWDAMIAVNLRGTLYGIAAALPHFKARKSGHIVNVVSTAGVKILPTMGVYAATKNAVRTATEAFGIHPVSRPRVGACRSTDPSPGVEP